MRRKGFTLIELIVVIAIIAILAAIIAPNAFKAIEKAKISASIEDFRSIKTGAMSYYSDTGAWVATCATSPCNAGFIATDAAAGWDGPYLEKWPPAAKWAGNYTWVNSAVTGIVFGVAPAVSERYVVIGNVPQLAAQRMDIALDGAVGPLTGAVRYSNATTSQVVNILVSRDGATN
ncbi:MAG: prepilin-type N-terminal cleavage/methylation domain-containing protein [Candidatus Omnitrophota bacterium]